MPRSNAAPVTHAAPGTGLRLHAKPVPAQRMPLRLGGGTGHVFADVRLTTVTGRVMELDGHALRGRWRNEESED